MRVAPRLRLVRRFEASLLQRTPPQLLLLSFILLSLLGMLLLKLPLASNAPTSWSLALFTAVSAATVTGLTLVDTGSHFTLFGHWVLLFLMQCGGLGLMTFGVFVIQLTSGKITLSHRAALSEALNQGGRTDLKRLLRLTFSFTLIMQTLGTTLLSLQWVPEMGWRKGLFYSFFHAVSAFNNAGFGLAADSLRGYVGNPLVNSVITLLFISGGIGFVVIADIMSKRRWRQYTLHTKLMLIGTLTLNLTAMLIILALEWRNPHTLAGLPHWGERLWAAWFQAVAPRTAGFFTIDIASLLPATAFFIMGLMFIGGGSGSTASGIKLSTFIVLLLATRAFLRRREHPVIFGRSLPDEVIRKALAITVISIFCVSCGIFALTITEHAPFLHLAFEAVSAFGTAGLSMGLSSALSLPGQCIIMLLMLIGRIGPLTLAFTLTRARSTKITYPNGQVNIG